MGDSWEEMRRAKEEQYFTRRNEQALKKIRAQQAGAAKTSPVSGKPMEHLVFKGVEIDRCQESGGVWLDKGELEKIIDAVLAEQKGERENWLGGLFSFLSEAKK